MQIAEHVNDGGGEISGGFVRGGHLVNFAHNGVDHEVGGVGFDHVGGRTGADDVGLVDLAWERGWTGRR